MNVFTFDQLPQAVSEISVKLDSIERLIRKNIDEPSQPAQDEFLTVLQVAELLNLSVPTIYGLVHKKDIPVCKRGKRLYFSKLEIRDWIRTGRKTSLAETEQATDNYIKKNESETPI